MGKRRIRSFVYGGAVGAAIAYFFDPDRGRARRATTRDQMLAKARRTSQRMERQARYAAGKDQGVAHRMSQATETPEDEYDDVTLARKVESEVLGAPDVPKVSINVNAVDGKVELRGEVRTPDQIKDIERRVREVRGVRDVNNLLHLPGTPARNKLEAREATG
jgi:osmotically-inducible protein OsmY